jgi:hypothetical protein
VPLLSSGVQDWLVLQFVLVHEQFVQVALWALFEMQRSANAQISEASSGVLPF